MMRKIIRHLLYLYIEWERKSRFSKKSMLKDIKKGDVVKSNWRRKQNFKDYDDNRTFIVDRIEYDPDAGMLAVLKDVGYMNFYWIDKA